MTVQHLSVTKDFDNYYNFCYQVTVLVLTILIV